MQGTCMIKRAIELSTSNIHLNVDLIGFIGFCGSELKVESCRIDNSFESKTFSSILFGKSTTNIGLFNKLCYIIRVFMDSKSESNFVVSSVMRRFG